MKYADDTVLYYIIFILMTKSHYDIDNIHKRDQPIQRVTKYI